MWICASFVQHRFFFQPLFSVALCGNFFAISFKKWNIIRRSLQMTCKFPYYFDRSMRIACNYHIHRSISGKQRWEYLMIANRPVFTEKRISEFGKIYLNSDFAFLCQLVVTCCLKLLKREKELNFFQHIFLHEVSFQKKKTLSNIFHTFK